ncbi:MAG: type II secretion system F family protein [Planctomycetes bacterium]|nr:type II secretion system F family protein [Planctomycetota bacterium]
MSLAVLLLAEALKGLSILPLIYLLSFLGVFIFTFVGFLVMSEGWESYEERYLEGAERTMDDLFLTIPPKQLLWLTVLAAGFAAVFGFVASKSLLMGLIAGVLGGLAPRVGLILHKKKRREKFNNQLVGALNTITNALRTGFSLPKAFQLISTDMPKPICQEFGILIQTIRLGSEIEEALEDMVDRMPSQDLDLMVTSITISNEVGGNLAEVFDRIAFTIRERRRIEGRIDSLTAQGKAQGCIVAALPVVLGAGIYWIDPKLIMPFFTDPRGNLVLAVMILMEISGYLLIQKITTIEV